MPSDPYCAVCGLALRKGQKAGFIDCYIVHRACVGTAPRETWAVARDEQGEVDRVTDLLGREIGHLETQRAAVVRELNDVRLALRLDKQCLNDALERERLANARRRTDVSRLETELQRLRDSMGTAPVIRTTQPLRTTERDPADHAFRAHTIGATVGRGIWGWASWLAQKLDRLDPTVARFALLELS